MLGTLSRVKQRLSRLSVRLNEMRGGEPGRTICWQLATDRGPDCFACKLIGWVLFERDHCRREIE